MTRHDKLIILLWSCFIIILFFVFVFTIVYITGSAEFGRNQAIFESGLSAAMEGAPPDVCPYNTGTHRKTWMDGFRKGLREKNHKE